MKKVIVVISALLVFGLLSTGFAEEVYHNGKMDLNGTLGKDGRSWRQAWVNDIYFEGATSNGYETRLNVVDPTADRVISFPNVSGTVLTTGSASSSLPVDAIVNGADGQVLVSTAASSGTNAWRTMSGDATITNAGAVTVGQVDGQPVDFADTTDGKIQVATNAGSGSWDAVAVSGDATITNAGAVTVTKINGVSVGAATATSAQMLIADGNYWQSRAISGDATITNVGAITVAKINGVSIGDATATSGKILIGDGTYWQTETMDGDVQIATGGTTTIQNNKIGDAEMNVSTSAIQVATGTTGGTLTGLTAGSRILGFYPVANIAASMVANTVGFSGTTAFICTTAANNAAYMEWNLVILEP